MIPNHLLFWALCLATLVSPQALESQTFLTIESLELNTYSQTADFTLTLQSKDLDWKVAGNGRSKADLILITASLDKRGDVLFYERESRSITADTEDAVKLTMSNTPLSTKVKILTKTNKVRFLIESADQREIGEFEVDRKTIDATAAPQLPPLPCRTHSQCYP
jgi:hypothetical protein